MMKEQMKIFGERLGGMLLTALFAAAFAFISSLENSASEPCIAAADPATAGAAGAAIRGVYQFLAFGKYQHAA